MGLRAVLGLRAVFELRAVFGLRAVFELRAVFGLRAVFELRAVAALWVWLMNIEPMAWVNNKAASMCCNRL